MKKKQELNDKQTEIYNLLYGAMWHVIDKTIPTDKKLRSVGFAKSREQARKLVLKSKLYIRKTKTKFDINDFFE